MTRDDPGRIDTEPAIAGGWPLPSRANPVKTEEPYVDAVSRTMFGVLILIGVIAVGGLLVVLFLTSPLLIAGLAAFLVAAYFVGVALEKFGWLP